MGKIENGNDIPEDWSTPASPIEVLHQFPQEMVKLGGEAWQNGCPDSPNTPVLEEAPRHRRAYSEITTSFHKWSDNTSSFHKLKSQMKRALQWGGRSMRDEARYSSFDPEILANQKRQWYQINSKTSGPEKYKDPTSLFEHFVIVGLGPDAKLQILEDAFVKKKKWEHGMEKTEVLQTHTPKHQRPTIPTLEPEALFLYPPGKKLPLRLKDLTTFCFPGGVKAHILERTPSLSELNELVFGQEHLRRNDLSFIFSLKVAGNTTLYGVCLYVQEVLQRPPVLSGASSPLSQSTLGCSRFLVSAPRCYCILTRVPFFELHYEMLNSIVAQERLNRITKFVTEMSLVDNSPSPSPLKNNHTNENIDSPGEENSTDWMASAIPVDNAVTLTAAAAGIISDEEASSRCGYSPVSDTSDKDGCKNTQSFDDCTSENSENQSTGGCTPDCHRNQSLEFPRSFESLFS